MTNGNKAMVITYRDRESGDLHQWARTQWPGR